MNIPKPAIKHGLRPNLSESSPQKKVPIEKAKRYIVRVYSIIELEVRKARAISGRDGVYTVSDNWGSPAIRASSHTAGSSKFEMPHNGLLDDLYQAATKFD